jgi:hypothetical protein
VGWKDKSIELFKRLGEPGKFSAKLALGAMLPGSPAVVELVCSALDCVHEPKRLAGSLKSDEAAHPPGLPVARLRAGRGAAVGAAAGTAGGLALRFAP